MCIAILNTFGTLPESHIRNSFSNNPDGVGMAWIQNGKIETFRTMKDIEKLISLYKDIRTWNEYPILLHFRIGTHGRKDLTNVHPFSINSDLVMIHNGIVDSPVIDVNKSDTYPLSLFLSKLDTYRNLIDEDSLEFGFCESLAGTYSKIVFMNNEGRYSIVNEDLGHWIDNDWYSNYTYQACDYYDVGGKSVKKYNQKYFEHSNWYDDIATDYGIEYDSTEGLDLELSDFCDLHGLRQSEVSAEGIDWNTDSVWEIENWTKFEGIYHYTKGMNL
jgi:hypothetical protein